jgi:hypothetical protein
MLRAANRSTVAAACCSTCCSTGAAERGEYSIARCGVQGGRHHQQPLIAARGLLQAAQQGEREVAFEAPLVEFVEHHASVAREGWVG